MPIDSMSTLQRSMSQFLIKRPKYRHLPETAENFKKELHQMELDNTGGYAPMYDFFSMSF